MGEARVDFGGAPPPSGKRRKGRDAPRDACEQQRRNMAGPAPRRGRERGGGAASLQPSARKTGNGTDRVPSRNGAPLAAGSPPRGAPTAGDVLPAAATEWTVCHRLARRPLVIERQQTDPNTARHGCRASRERGPPAISREAPHERGGAPKRVGQERPAAESGIVPHGPRVGQALEPTAARGMDRERTKTWGRIGHLSGAPRANRSEVCDGMVRMPTDGDGGPTQPRVGRDTSRHYPPQFKLTGGPMLPPPPPPREVALIDREGGRADSRVRGSRVGAGTLRWTSLDRDTCFLNPRRSVVLVMAEPCVRRSR